jgi:hypothetical protein
MYICLKVSAWYSFSQNLTCFLVHFSPQSLLLLPFLSPTRGGGGLEEPLNTNSKSFIKWMYEFLHTEFMRTAHSFSDKTKIKNTYVII